MNTVELEFLNNALKSFVYASLQRTAQTGAMVFPYRLTLEEMKSVTNRQRVNASTIHDIIGFFEAANVSIKYNESFLCFDILLDLNCCRLSIEESKNLSFSISHFNS